MLTRELPRVSNSKHMATLPRTSGHVAQDIWSCCQAYHPAMLPSTSGHVAQDKPCCSGHLAKLPGHLAMLPRTCDGHVAQDIWPCCPGYRVATLHRNQAMLPRISSGRAAEAVRPCCPVHLAMLPRLSGHVAQDIVWQCFWLLAMLRGMGVTAFHKERMLRSTRRSYRSHS